MSNQTKNLHARHGSAFFPRLLIILMLFGSAYAAFYIFYNQSKSSEQATTPTIAPPAEPTPTPEWSTYTNSIKTVSLSYPPEWDLKEDGTTATLSSEIGKIIVEWGTTNTSIECDQQYHKTFEIKGRSYDTCGAIDSEGVYHGGGFSNNLPGDRHTEVFIQAYKPFSENAVLFGPVLATLTFPDLPIDIVAATPAPTSSLSCTPRPACLDESPPCKMPETPDMCSK